MKAIFRITYLNILAILGIVSLSGCIDDFFYEQDGDMTGDVYVDLEMTFSPTVDVNLGTRSNGNAIDEIKNVFVAIYKDAPESEPERMELVQSYFFNDTDLQFDLVQESSDSQDAIRRARPKQRVKLPTGVYHMLVAANVDDITDKVKNMAEFFNYPLASWNSSDISANNAMSGYFSNYTQTGLPQDITKIPDLSKVTVSSRTGSLHAWLRRAASKVTVDFDGSGLYENVFVYIRSVQLRDIPKNCPLYAPNTPSSASELESYGEKISVDTLSTAQDLDHYYQLLPCITKEGNTYHDFFPNPHANNSKASMFFYENLQGIGKDKRQDANGDYEIDAPNDPSINKPEDQYNWKDEKPYGTWVEVKGYFVSNSPHGRGRGEITYRFMLGQDTKTDYNAYRNVHYKLTLSFKGLANDVDWHIDYTDVTSPGIHADVFYVSYLYNQPQLQYADALNKDEYWEKLHPIRIAMADGDELADEIEVRIMENNWKPDLETGDITGYEYYTGNVKTSLSASGTAYTPTCGTNGISTDGIWNGFLSLYKYEGLPTSVATGGRYSASVYKDWYSRGSNPWFPKNSDPISATDANASDNFNYGEGYRKFKTKVGEYTTGDDATYGEYRVTEEVVKGERFRIIWIPLYTRPLVICQSKAFSGNNPYYSFRRKAKLKITASWGSKNNMKPHDQTTTVYQVRRIVNPKGVFRDNKNTNAFNVTLMYRTGETLKHEFIKFSSIGPWRAKIVAGSGWSITSTSSGGGTGGSIGVTVAPSGVITDNVPRCALLKFEYNNYTCVHYVALRQGYAPLKIDDGNVIDGKTFEGPKWRSFNLITKNKDTGDPLDEGSLFRFGNLDNPIDAINNQLFPTKKEMVNKTASQYYIANDTRTNMSKKAWGTGTDIASNATNINSAAYNNSAAVAAFKGKINGGRIPKNEDFKAIFKNPEIEFGFGVCYGDGATECSVLDNEVYNYTWYNRMATSDGKTIAGGNQYSDPNGRFGIRAAFVYNKKDARVIMFPMGATGYGSRKHNNSTGGTSGTLGALRYGGVADLFHKISPNGASCAPMLEDLYTQYGALYWLSDMSDDDIWKTEDKKDAMAWDINYSTLDFGPYPRAEIFATSKTNNSHACFIRLVE